MGFVRWSIEAKVRTGYLCVIMLMAKKYLILWPVTVKVKQSIVILLNVFGKLLKFRLKIFTLNCFSEMGWLTDSYLRRNRLRLLR